LSPVMNLIGRFLNSSSPCLLHRRRYDLTDKKLN
jgi:hypothetical protein